MRTFDNEGGESCLVALSVHPVKSYLLFDRGYTKFLSGQDFLTLWHICLVQAPILRSSCLTPDCQCCVHGEYRVPLGFQI